MRIGRLGVVGASAREAPRLARKLHDRNGRAGQWALAEERFRQDLASVDGGAFLAGVAAGRSMSLTETVIEAAGSG